MGTKHEKAKLEPASKCESLHNRLYYHHEQRAQLAAQNQPPLGETKPSQLPIFISHPGVAQDGVRVGVGVVAVLNLPIDLAPRLGRRHDARQLIARLLRQSSLLRGHLLAQRH